MLLVFDKRGRGNNPKWSNMYMVVSLILLKWWNFIYNLCILTQSEFRGLPIFIAFHKVNNVC